MTLSLGIYSTSKKGNLLHTSHHYITLPYENNMNDYIIEGVSIVESVIWKKGVISYEKKNPSLIWT